MKNSVNLIIFLLSICMSAWGQTKPITISGTVLDEEGKVLPGAQIVLTQMTDTQKKYSIVASTDGKFTIPVSPGIYMLQSTYIGYRPFTAEVDASRAVSVDIPMIPEAQKLNEVVVKARRIRYDAEGYSMNVSQIPALKQETLDIILQFMPGLFVVNDRLTLFGRRYINEVYVNRRRLHMQGSQLLDYLNTIRGATVKNVKVIMSKGAEASASAANTVTLKITTESLSDGGMLSIGTTLQPTGTYRSYSLPTFRFQNKQGRWSSYGFLVNKLGADEGESETNTIFHSSGTTQRTSVSTDSKTASLHARLGVGYDFTPNDLLTIEVRTDFYKLNSHKDLRTETSDARTQLWITEDRGKNKMTNTSYQLSVDYSHAWKTGELSSSIGYIDGRDRNDGHQWRTTNDQAWDSHDYSKISSSIFSGKIDYNQKVGKNQTLKAGTAYNLWDYNTDTDNRLLVNGEKSPWGNYTDLFTYKERIAAVYGSYDFTLESFSASLGLRYEHETIDPSSQQFTQQDFKRTYDRLFPNLRLNYTINSKRGHNMRMTFSRALANPSRNNLNPSMQWENEYYYMVGNPHLSPIAYYQGDVTLTLFNRLMFNAQYQDRHIYHSYFHKREGDDIIYTSTDDSGKERSLQLNASYSKPFTKKWTMSVNVTSRFAHETYLEESMSNSSITVSMMSNNMLPKGYRLNTRWAWMSPQENLQVKTDGIMQFSTTLRKTFFKNRLNLSLGYEYFPISESTVKTADIKQRRTNNYNPHRIEFSAQYQLHWGSIRAQVRQAKGIQ